MRRDGCAPLRKTPRAWLGTGVVFGVLLALAAPAAAADSPIFLLDTDGLNYITLFLVDPTSGQLSTVGSLDPSFGEDFSLARPATISSTR